MGKQNEATQKQIALSEKNQITNQFNNAIEQLANSSLEVRIGGLITLKRLAQESPDLLKNIVEIIQVYAKTHFKAKSRIGSPIFRPGIGYFSDFKDSNVLSVPKGFKDKVEFKAKVIEVLKSQGFVNSNEVVIKNLFNAEGKLNIDLYEIVKMADVLGIGTDADYVLSEILKSHSYKETIPVTDIRIALDTITELLKGESYSTSMTFLKFNHIVISGYSFANIDFSYSDFHSSDLSFNSFNQCQFSDSIFNGAHLCCTIFENCDLSDTQFQFIKTWAGGGKNYYDKAENYLENNKRISFRNSKLERTYFRFSKLYFSDFSNTYQYNSQFGGTELQTSDFSESILQDVQFGEASAYSCNFRKSKLSGCSFNKTKLIGSDFSNCIFEPIDRNTKKMKSSGFPTIFDDADLKDVIFEDASLFDVDFRESKNLTFEQVIKAKTLKGARFDKKLMERIESEKPELLK